MVSRPFLPVINFYLTHTFLQPTLQQSLYDSEAAEIARQRFSGATSSGLIQSSDESIFSQVSQQRNSDSLLDLAGSSVISTKAFPFLTKYKRDDSVSRSIDEVASARSGRFRNEQDDQMLRLYTSDRDQLMSAPSTSYEEDSTSNLKTYYPQPQLAHHEDVQPEDRSYNLYPQNPGNSYERPPPPVPSSSYNKPKNNYEQSDEDHYQQQRQPAIIASNSPQGPVIHITLNQHLPLGGSDGDKDGMGNQQRDTGDMTPAPPATPTASDMPSGPSPAVAPPAAFPQFFSTFGQSQGFFPGGAQQYLLPINIPVPQPIQQSPPAALPAPVPPPTQPVVVVVSPNKKGGYSHYDSDSSGAGVKVVNGQYHTGAQQSYKKSRNEEVKGRSLSYTIRIPGDQSDDSQESRSSSYSRRPRTVISRNNRGAGEIYTSGSKPQEIFLNIGSDGIVRPSGKRRNKRSSDPQERKLLKFLQVDVAARQSRKGDPERLNKDKSPRRENKHIYKKEGKYHVP